MEFILHYRGNLKPNGGSQDKHDIRRHLHPQLKLLWEQPPLKFFRELLEPRGRTVIREVGAFRFAPLFAGNLNFVAELEITLLRPGVPGDIVRHGGDIDNRLKTLLDALAMPSQTNALPPGSKPDEGETPFFCLLEDDALITKLSVQTERLLEPVSSPSEVELMALVRTKTIAKEGAIFGLDTI